MKTTRTCVWVVTRCSYFVRPIYHTTPNSCNIYINEFFVSCVICLLLPHTCRWLYVDVELQTHTHTLTRTYAHHGFCILTLDDTLRRLLTTKHFHAVTYTLCSQRWHKPMRTHIHVMHMTGYQPNAQTHTQTHSCHVRIVWERRKFIDFIIWLIFFFLPYSNLTLNRLCENTLQLWTW